MLEVSALVLSIVNGLFLLKFYARDKPKLKVEPVSPNVYQWWFRIPDGKFQGHTTRRYGFVAYVGISNSGLRKVQLNSWRLHVRRKLYRRSQLRPLNMPEPKILLGNHEKYYPVLGQRGLHFDGSTLVDAGCSIAGMLFYSYECYGSDLWDPVVHDGKVFATFVVTPIFGRKCRCHINFSEKSMEEIDAIAPGIHLIFENKE